MLKAQSISAESGIIGFTIFIVFAGAIGSSSAPDIGVGVVLGVFFAILIVAVIAGGKWVLDTFSETALDYGTVAAGRDVTFSEGPPADTTSKAIREQLAQWQEQTRIIDANLLADRFAPGAVATLTVAIRLPESQSRGMWRRRAKINLGKGPIHVLVNALGFEAISEPPPPIVLRADRDSAPIAFELRILEASERWLHVLLTQAGSPIGELTIKDFSAIGVGPVRRITTTQVRTIKHADLTLVIGTVDDKHDVPIMACSPADRANLSYKMIRGFKHPSEACMDDLRDQIKALYNNRAGPEETETKLKKVGVELARSLPDDLVKLLRRPDIRSVILMHAENFEFPIELCYLDDDDNTDSFFIGDQIAVCRWYMDVKNSPDVTEKRIRKVAFLQGDDDAYKADEIVLKQHYPNRVVIFAQHSDVMDKLFKTSDFDLIHFTGHCQMKGAGNGGLKLADGSYLHLNDIGQFKESRVFAKAKPFVMVNACTSSGQYVNLTKKDSFPHRFVMSQACAFVGTLWPVSGPIANEFAKLFYAELAKQPVGLALLAAKKTLMDKTGVVNRDAEVGGVSRRRQVGRQIAMRSYCLFANPDLSLSRADEV